MSTTIDQRVVEMRFDNQHFEKNVQTSLSTLDKLKQKLNLTGASKGLENLGAAAKKADLSPIANGVENVRMHFSALDVMATTALANITNQAVNAGKRIASALTIDPIKTGFQEYETQINAVQTILANTQSKGTTLDDVNQALDTLNAYADKTIYNFTEMTRNIGTFTAAGVDLDTSVNAIQGIANLAAVSGSTSQQASTAMYQLSQALASGTVKLMDWNSVVNAGMGGQVFQDALKETARVHGVAIDSMIKEQGSFRETLSEGWLTSEILTETLQKFTLTTEGLTKEQIEANREMLRAKGYTEDQINEIFKLGDTATQAATKVKTFTQLWDVLKEAAQSGWTQSWEIIVGDFEEAKALLTPLSDFLTGIINKMSEWRNSILEKALGSPFGKIAEKIKDMSKAGTKAIETIQNIDEIATKVIRGDFGNGQERRDKLTEAYGSWEAIQNRVNEMLGDSYRHTVKAAEGNEQLAESQATSVEQMLRMSKAQLKKIGLNDEEIESLKNLAEISEKTGVSISKIMEDPDSISGRTLLINSFKNLGKAIMDSLSGVKEAWQDIFPPKSIEERAEQLYNLIAGLHKFTTGIRNVIHDGENFTETGDKLVRTFKGVFAALDIVLTIVGGPLKIAFKVITSILSAFDLNILDVTAAIGDAIVGFRDWIDSVLDFGKYAKRVPEFIDRMRKAITKWFGSFSEGDNIPGDIIAGLAKGIREGAPEVFSAIVDLAKTIFFKFCEVLGIHSPSREFEEAGGNIIDGLVNGIQNGASRAWEAIKGLGAECVEVFKSIDFGKLFAAGLGVSLIVIGKKLVDVLAMFASPLDGLGGMLGDVGEGLKSMLTGIGSAFKANAFEKRSIAIRNFAIAIGILAASVALLSQIKAGSLWKAVAVIGALAVILGALAIAVSKFAGSTDFGISFALKSSGLVGLVTSILIFVGAIKLLSTVDVDSMESTLAIMAGIVVSLGVLAVAIGKLADGGTVKYMGRVGKMFTKMAIALLIMVGVIKLIGMLKENEIKKGLVVVGILELFMLGLVAVGRLAGKEIGRVGGMLLKVSMALLIMVGVIKLAAQLDAWEIEKGVGAIAILELLFMGIIGVSKLAGQYGAKAGSMLLMMSGAILILIGAIKLIAGIDEKDLTMGLGVIATLEILFMAVIAVSKLAGENAMKAGAMLTMMSTALAILTGVIFILSKIDPQGLVRGLGAVAVLEILFMGLIAATHLATDCMGPLIVMTVAIGILAAAVIGMSFIDPSRLAGATIAMSMLVGVFAILVAASKNVGKAIPVALMMGLVLLELVGIFALLKLFDINPSIESAGALSILLIAMSAACVILSRVGYLATSAIMGAVGLAGVIAVVAVVLAALGGLSKIPGFNDLIKDGGEALALIGYAIGNFVGSIVGGLAAGVTSGLPEIGANLSAFMANVAPFIAGIKMVDSSVLAGTGFLAGSILALSTANIMQGLKSFLPNVGSLAELGSDLSSFMVNARPFITGASLLNEDMMAGVKALADTILTLTQANLLDGLASLLGQESSLSSFGSQLPMLGAAISNFATNLNGFSEEQLTTVKCAADAIKVLAEASAEIPNTGGLLGAIVGENDLGNFASQFPVLGMGLKAFLANVGTFTEEQVATVKCAADAIKILAEASSAIPNTGGLLGAIVGDNDLGTFAAQFPILATGLKGFLTNIGTFTDEQLATITCAANAVKTLANASSKIPNMGGWLAAIVGDNSLGTFASQFPSLGTGLRGFLDNVGTFTDAEVATVGCAANAVKVLAAASQNIDGQAEWAKKLFGDNGLSALGDEMASLGTGLSGFVTNLGVFTTDQVNTVNCAVQAIKSFAGLAGTDLKSAQQNLPKFGEALPGFATDFGSFCTNMPSTAAVSVATDNIDMILGTVDSIASKDPMVIPNFIIALNDAGAKGVKEFINAFTDTKTLSSIKTAGKDLVTKIIEGIEDKLSALKKAFKDAASAGAEAIKDKYQSFYNAGSYLVDGFAAGISENDYKAEAKARAMAKAAAKAAEEALDINSPSKVFRAIGYSVPEGFAMGIDRMSKLVSGSAEGMADTALNSTKDSISRIADIINSDIDAQPTIRPVLDLSNIRSGAGAINGLLGENTSIGLLTNVGTVSSMMNSRSQNGTNGDVVSAINKLRSELGNMSGNTYNVNGVTYDDGSNIATAVKEIARAALRERRT